MSIVNEAHALTTHGNRLAEGIYDGVERHACATYAQGAVNIGCKWDGVRYNQ